MRFSLLRFFVIACLCFLGIKNASAATYDWVGGNSANWSSTTNWQQGIVPTATDNVQIGVLYAITQAPNINGITVNVKSITFGALYGSGVTIGINLKNSGILNVTNDITVQADANTLAQGTNTIYLTGNTGTITATNLNITSNYAASASYSQYVVTNIGNFNLSGNIALTTSDNGTSSVVYNAAFDLVGAITNVVGKLSTTNSTYGTSSFIINPNTNAGATLQLANAYALSSLSANGTNNITFNNTYATVEYCGAAQTIYSDLAITGLAAGGPGLLQHKIFRHGH